MKCPNVAELLELDVEEYMHQRTAYAIHRYTECGFFSEEDKRDMLVMAQARWLREYWQHKVDSL